MSKDKEIINKLFKVVSNQQKIITKLAQNAAPPVGDMRTSVEADIMDLVYGKGAKLPLGSKVQVHYAKVAPGPGGNVLSVGLTVPPAVQEKFQHMKSSLELALKNRYGVTAVTWRE